ncbi:MAG TPA: hypothetical protein VF308_08560 [Caldimonas sp.]
MTITIRRASPDDADAYARIMGDPAVYGGLMQMPYTDAADWRARLTDLCARGKPDLPLAAELRTARSSERWAMRWRGYIRTRRTSWRLRA